MQLKRESPLYPARSTVSFNSRETKVKNLQDCGYQDRSIVGILLILGNADSKLN